MNAGRRHHRTRWLGHLVAGLWAGLTGCGSSDSLPALPVYEVTGKVLLSNGKPLEGGWISFVPKGDLTVTPSGPIGPDGTFSLVTGGSGNGAPLGDYKVRIEAPQFQQAPSRSKKRSPFPTKYSDEDSSGIIVSVRAEANRLEPIRLR
jgi:hypothetical protein